MTRTDRGRPVAPTRAVLDPLDVEDVRIGPGFWGDRQQLNGDVVLGHCRGWMDRLGWIDNFRLAAAGRLPSGRRGREFSDADVYKLVEAMCWEACRTGGSALDQGITELGAVIAGAQGSDGYLNTRFGHLAPGDRYGDLEWGHELYCHGHLVQAGVARLRTAGAAEPTDDPVVSAARRAADQVCREFGRDGRPGVDGHPEIEMALVELYRATGEERYLAQAQAFIERRGKPALADVAFGRAYFQDDVPLREATALRGHAVRALYLACGAVDVAVESGDRELLEIVADQWRHTLATRTYLTGGMGSRHEGESFGDDYELPADRAYAETCAGVASVMLAWRLLLATGEASCADAIERTLFNVVATALAPDGRAFFYTNPLHVRVPAPACDPTVESPRAHAGLRAPWFTVACCPPNVARLLASLSAYVATTDRSGLQLHQFVPGRLRARLDDGGSVRLRVETDYPWSGRVTVHVEDCSAAAWRLAVRMPAWAGELTLEVGGDVRTVTASAVAATKGYASVDRVWRAGDQLRIELPVRPRWTRPDPRVDAVRGTVAVERGPLVYCAEAPVAASASSEVAPDLALVTVDEASEPVDLGVGVALRGARTVGVMARQLWADGPPRMLGLIPYHLWGNRGPATMRVWLPIEPRSP